MSDTGQSVDLVAPDDELVLQDDRSHLLWTAARNNSCVIYDGGHLSDLTLDRTLGVPALNLGGHHL